MKKLLILVGALFLIAGGTVSVMKWMNLGPFQEKAAQQEEAPSEPTLLVDMEPLLIPIFQGDKVAISPLTLGLFCRSQVVSGGGHRLHGQ